MYGALKQMVKQAKEEAELRAKQKDIIEMSVQELQIEVAMLRERCEQLQIRLDKANQYPPVRPIWNPAAPPYNSNYSKCTKCGIDLSKNMGYVCGDSSCPTTVRVTC
jgi:hypothetical protein